MLGIGSIKVDSAQMFSSRFGIDIKEHEFSAGIITITPSPAGRCHVKGKSNRNRLAVSLEADVFFPEISGLPTSHMKFIIRNTFIEITVTQGKCHFEFKFDPNKICNLDELTQAVGFLKVCGSNDKKIFFEKDGKKFLEVDGSQTLKFDHAYNTLYEYLIMVRNFLDLSRFRLDCEIKICNLFDQKEVLKYINLALTQKPLTVTSELSESNELSIKNQHGILAVPVLLMLGSRKFLAQCYWNAKFSLKGQKIAAKVGRAEVWSGEFVEALEDADVRESQIGFQNFCRENNRGMLMWKELEFSEPK